MVKCLRLQVLYRRIRRSLRQLKKPKDIVIRRQEGRRVINEPSLVFRNSMYGISKIDY